jgi:hypothetical protein
VGHPSEPRAERGNTTQFVQAQWSLTDQAVSIEAARYHIAEGDDWVATGTSRKASTLTAHIGGTINLQLYLLNRDSNSQSFFSDARAAYVTGL